MVSFGKIIVAAGHVVKKNKDSFGIMTFRVRLREIPWARVDQVGQGFHGDQQGPVGKSGEGKHHQKVMEISISLHIGTELMETVALLLWMRPEGGCRLSGELQPSCYLNLLSYTSTLLCVCVSWVVRYLGLALGGRSLWKMGLCGAASPYGCGFLAPCCLALFSPPSSPFHTHAHMHTNIHLPSILMSNADHPVSKHCEFLSWCVFLSVLAVGEQRNTTVSESKQSEIYSSSECGNVNHRALSSSPHGRV